MATTTKAVQVSPGTSDQINAILACLKAQSRSNIGTAAVDHWLSSGYSPEVHSRSSFRKTQSVPELYAGGGHRHSYAL
jgi:hypothetical protein